MKTVFGCLVLLLAGGSVLFSTESGVSQEIGLEVLKSYEGIWDSEFSIVGNDGQKQTFTGVVTGKWVVGDKFLEQTGVYNLSASSPPLIIKTMMSFDRKQNRYQYDYFESSGGVQRSFGQWNAGKKTMVSKMVNSDGGTTATIVADFSTPGIENWVIETKNQDGATVAKMVGTNTLRKTDRP